MHLPVSEPFLDDTESRLVSAAMSEKAISGFFGSHLSEFERRFAEFCGCSRAVAVTSGTTAIHLALVVLDIGPGDEVLVATYTNMASFFPVLTQGAHPIPVDIEPDTWNINPSEIESKINKHTKAIIVVHIFGHPVDMDPVLAIAQKYGLYVIEDCAQAHGALYRGKPVGSIGTIGCFSFYANKIITTGEGGMLTTNDPALADRAAAVKSLAFGKTNKFMHTEIGYNYRMTNLQAAIGCGQMDKIHTIIDMKRRIAQLYNDRLKTSENLQLPVEMPYARNVFWMYHVVLRESARLGRDEVMAKLADRGIETRPGFLPFNMQEIFIERGIAEHDSCPIANYVGNNSFYLPSGPQISEHQIDYVAESLLRLI